MRAQCSVFIAVSVDGFIARPDGGIDWLSVVERPGEDYGYQRFFDSVDTLLIGRKTYDVALGFEPWPYAGKRCVVLSHRALTPRHDETFESGAPLDVVDRLTALGCRRIYVDGGSVIQQLLAAGLVTDLTLNVVPVVLGEGVPLFGKTGRDLRLELVDTRRFDSGLVQVEYRSVR